MGDRVRFHIHTEGLADGVKINLKLWDSDGILNPDDDEFSEKRYAVEATAEIRGRNAMHEFTLGEGWDINIYKDIGNVIELYWEVSYYDDKAELPAKSGDYLSVSYSDRDLFIKPHGNTQMPELVSISGGVLSFYQVASGELKS